MSMLNHGHMILAALYVLGSLWGGLVAAWMGVCIGESVRGGVRRS
jgi:fluoride exporter